MKFNPSIHCVGDDGSPVVTKSGQFRLKPNWKDSMAELRDHLGRKYNVRIHGDPELTEEGLLKVQIRRGVPHIPGRTNRTEAWVNQYREPGYEYRVVNDYAGRITELERAGYEPVSDENGTVQRNGGMGPDQFQAVRQVLMRVPQEIHEDIQRAKHRRNEDAVRRQAEPSGSQYVPDRAESALRTEQLA